MCVQLYAKDVKYGTSIDDVDARARMLMLAREELSVCKWCELGVNTVCWMGAGALKAFIPY